MPEPESFGLFFITGMIFLVGALVTWGLRQRGSRPPNGEEVTTGPSIFTWLPLGCGTVLFALMAFAMAAWAIYWVLPHHLATREEIAGRYVGTYQGGQETLELHADGTFDQTIVLPDRRNFTQHSRWDLTESGDAIMLTVAFDMIDGEREALRPEPERLSGLRYQWFSGSPATLNRDPNQVIYQLKRQ